MKKPILLFALSIIALLSFGQQQKKPYVILISFDGFRSDYVERFNLLHFKDFIKNGASAEALIPSFPSKTFPNHYALVTGLYPGHHGLVDNHFYDPDLKMQYSMRMREAVLDSRYYGGTPLWQLAKQGGVRSASYFWVGSELKDENLHPDYFFAYNQNVPFGERMDQVIDWLRLPENERPHLITLYFSSPDTESHKYGPFAEETKQTALRMDSLFGDFVKRIDSTNLPMNIIIVSDHGMSELRENEETYIFLDDLVKTQGTIVAINGGTQAHIYTGNSRQTDSLYNILQTKAKDFSVLKRKDFPQRWHYDNRRSGDLLLLGRPGKYIISGDRNKFLKEMRTGATFGVHGYDPDIVRDMHGIFYAKGPNIKPGVVIQPFRNIHVYPLIAKILDLKIPKIDGRFEVLKPIYKK